MNTELRWKMKTKVTQEPIYPDRIGSPTKEVILNYKVLEYRRHVDEHTATEWGEVPHVGLDT